MTAASVEEQADEHVDESYRPGFRHWAGITWMLAMRTFRIRYLRSRLGVGWALLQPLVQAAVLSFVFLKVFRIQRVDHYPLYVLSGIMTWQAVSGSISMATTAAVDNGALLRKIAMPAVIFPVAQAGSVMVVFGMQLVVLVGFAVVSGTAGLGVLLLPLLALMVPLVALGVGLLACAFHVALRDVKFFVESGLLVVFYASPILYDPSRVPDSIRPWLSLNPAYGVLSLARTALLGRPFEALPVFTSMGVSLLLLVLGAWAFRVRSRDFADLA